MGRQVDEALDRIGFGNAQWRAIVTGGGIFAADGSELLLISSITNAVGDEWQLNGTEKGMVVTLVYVGVLLGNALSGTGDLLGRRMPILLSYLGIVVFSVLSAITLGPWTMGLCRMLVGISFGLGQPAWNTLGVEISPSAYRVAVNAASQVMFVFGELFSGVLLWADDPSLAKLNWRRLLILGAAPSVLLGIGAIFLLVESPSYLVHNGKAKEARESLESLARANGNEDVALPSVADLEEDERQRKAREAARAHTGWKKRMDDIWGSKRLVTTLVLCVSCFGVNFLYYGAIYALPQVLPQLKLHLSPGANLILGAAMELPGYLLAVWLARHTTRKVSLQCYLLSSCASILFFLHGTGMDHTMEVTKAQQHPWAIYVGVIGMKAFVNIGFVVIYAYSSEVYPTSSRTTGTATILASGRLGAMACPLVYELLLEHTGHYHHFFLVIAGLTAANSALATLLTIETAGKHLSEMDELEPLHCH